jgi:hypothetical protein
MCIEFIKIFNLIKNQKSHKFIGHSVVFFGAVTH